MITLLSNSFCSLLYIFLNQTSWKTRIAAIASVLINIPSRIVDDRIKYEAIENEKGKVVDLDAI
jgi:hypothetical protein